MAENVKISILGAEYDFAESTEKEDSRLSDVNGYCDGSTKTIRVENDYHENHPRAIQNFDEFKKRTKRHEVIHAFFYESGLLDYYENEQIVDWIAYQFPKMLAVFNEIDAV